MQDFSPALLKAMDIFPMKGNEQRDIVVRNISIPRMQARLLLLFLFLGSLVFAPRVTFATDSDLAPVAYEGRFRPMEAYAKMTGASDAEGVWKRHFRGDEPWKSMKLLPDREGNGFWHPAAALKGSSSNITLYTDALYDNLRQTYLKLESALSKDSTAEAALLQEKLSSLLLDGYTRLAGTPYKKAFGKELRYPTATQLKAELFYYHYPLVKATLALYALATALFVLGLLTQTRVYFTTGFMALLAAFALHSSLLLLRCYILGRPPVSNMFETVLYVPWIAVLASLIANAVRRLPALLTASAFLSLILLIILEASRLNMGMENVQAVLDSQFWLIIHVLMVVGSYGMFLLAGVLGHAYLMQFALYKKETETMSTLARSMLQTLYLGTALLIPGTILGGIWAAQSWGRFWDWDPKESWAFISSGVYLMGIHAYRFGHMGNFGLAAASILGLQSITFTWYGVNYILGTGLHSYGFGSGGEGYYYAFVVAEGAFVAMMLGIRKIATKPT